MRGFVGQTDHGWYSFFLNRLAMLRERHGITEVNFWRPGGRGFSALAPGEPFLFRLKAPHDAIGGFGFFSGFQSLPVWLAWEVFGQANGCEDEFDFGHRLARLSPPGIDSTDPERHIGCISVADPVFFAPDEWVAEPSDWKRNIVSGKSYDLTQGPGAEMWAACLARAAAREAPDPFLADAHDRQLTGKPQLVIPRLGQGTFRRAVLDAYGGACAVTSEHSVPVLEAAHIRPWHDGGLHELSNGVPLRRDVHRLFDLGYVTIRPDFRFAVSPRLKQEYANGKVYYELDGREIALPAAMAQRPDTEHLEWHGDVRFRAA